MKKSIMKRISLMLLISVLVMMFVGCNADTDTEEPMNSQETQVPATQEGEDENTDVPEEIEEEEEIEDEGDGTPFNNGDKKRVKARGLYLTASTAGARLDHYIELANTTEINAYVIDLKMTMVQ